MRTATLAVLLLCAACTDKPGGVPVLLSVESNPPAEVTVIPPAGVGRDRVVLGRTPVVDAKGVFVGDRVLLENLDAGVRYEEPIEYGQPGERKRISKEFGPTQPR